MATTRCAFRPQVLSPRPVQRCLRDQARWLRAPVPRCNVTAAPPTSCQACRRALLGAPRNASEPRATTASGSKTHSLRHTRVLGTGSQPLPRALGDPLLCALLPPASHPWPPTSPPVHCPHASLGLWPLLRGAQAARAGRREVLGSRYAEADIRAGSLAQ